jgi:N-acetylglutamate synthase-like GNAT family acetyltransferase
MMPHIKIESYKDEHKSQIIDLILKIQRDEFSVAITIEDQPDLLQIPSFYVKDKGNFWVALENNEVVGCIALKDIGNSQCALRKMFVAKEYRGKEKNIAQQLLDTLLAASKAKGVKEIYLGTIEKYHAARRFYERNGFIELPKEQLPENFPMMQVDNHFYVYQLGSMGQ